MRWNMRRLPLGLGVGVLESISGLWCSVGNGGSRELQCRGRRDEEARAVHRTLVSGFPTYLTTDSGLRCTPCAMSTFLYEPPTPLRSVGSRYKEGGGRYIPMIN